MERMKKDVQYFMLFVVTASIRRTCIMKCVKATIAFFSGNGSIPIPAEFVWFKQISCLKVFAWTTLYTIYFFLLIYYFFFIY